jgi:cell wall-associated NlpC family hydrolase
MRWTLIAAALCLAGTAVAAPGTATTASSDELDKLIAERGLVGQLQQMRQKVEDKTSELVMNAMGFLGVPYKRGGNSPEAGGFDCSGFVRAIYEQTVGLVLPRKAEQQAAATQKIDKSELKPGDLVFFNTLRRAFSHVGIYVGDGKFIHSPRAGAEVRVEDMRTSYWQRRFDGARRVESSQEAAFDATALRNLPTGMNQTMPVAAPTTPALSARTPTPVNGSVLP